MNNINFIMSQLKNKNQTEIESILENYKNTKLYHFFKKMNTNNLHANINIQPKNIVSNNIIKKSFTKNNIII